MIKLAATDAFKRALGRAPDGFVMPSSVEVKTDALGMAVLQSGKNETQIGIYALDELPKNIAHIIAAYGLKRRALEDVDIYYSALPAAPADDVATALFEFVMKSDLGTAKAAVIGAVYQLAAYEVAKGDFRPTAITTSGTNDNIHDLEVTTKHRSFYATQSVRYAHERFDGGLSARLERAILTTGDAVIVLPYDPHLGKVVLIEQIRPAALARRSMDAWGLEAVAGVIGLGETPEYTAERELEEEAGLQSRGLYRLSPSYPSPGALSQFMYSFIAHVDLSDYKSGIFGLESEAEDIKTHLMTVDEALALLRSGEINIMPLQYCLTMLALDRTNIDKAFESN